MPHISTHNKILVLRFTRLSYVPPGQNTTQILHEMGYPIAVIEYGYIHEKVKKLDSPFPTLRLENPWLRHAPHALHSPSFVLSTLRRIGKMIIKEGKPQLIIAHGLSEQVIAYGLNRWLGIPYAIHAHEILEPNEVRGISKLYFKLEKPIYKHAQFVMAPEAERASIINDRYQHNCPTAIVYNCPRPRPKPTATDLRKRLNLGKDTVLLGYIGGIGPANPPEIVIDTLPKFKQLHFLLWGWSDATYLRQLQARAKQLNVESQLHLLGITQNKFEDLAGCDIAYCVYAPADLRTQHIATASNKFSEAMACALPTLTSNRPDFKQIVDKYQLGVCLSSITPEGLSEALSQLLQSPQIRTQMGRNARKAFEQEFNYDHQFTKAAPLFEHLSRNPTEEPKKRLINA